MPRGVRTRREMLRQNTILRHLGRKFNLFGATAEARAGRAAPAHAAQEATFLDFFNDGVACRRCGA